MVDSINNNAQETPACCCLDMGTVIDNEHCSVTLNDVFATKDEAEQMLSTLTELAKQVASDPCEIISNIHEVAERHELSVSFNFCCQAETLIFQLKLRKLPIHS
ncbi:YfcZ/YiiS family protein [Neisseria sp. Ec49-e6-T10]|uniref:YfcZ/YiiS family protein n=1 Tax=Neisseria sp. Ec49-e6-T10 TaxID=3140744 RepID=UPI003EBF1A74